MSENVLQCGGRQIGRSKLDPPMYRLHGQVLCITDNTKYLGLTITSDLKWNSQIQKVTSKANSVFVCLEKKLKDSVKSCENTYLGYITRYLFLAHSAQEDLTVGNLHPSSLTVIHSNFHLFHAQLLLGMPYTR